MPKTVLVVDDDPDIVRVVKDDLEAEGYGVLTGLDGQMAIRLAQGRHPDLIILDVDMPLTNGLQTFTILRHNPATQTIPVIFLTGVLSERVLPILQSAQRVAHLKKPLDLEHLNEMVRLFLQKYPTA